MEIRLLNKSLGRAVFVTFYLLWFAKIVVMLVKGARKRKTPTTFFVYLEDMTHKHPNWTK
jgi:hypothetical protein